MSNHILVIKVLIQRSNAENEKDNIINEHFVSITKNYLRKKLDSLNKENYSPVSLLPHLSKVFARIIYKQINGYMENKLTKCLTGFRKSHYTTLAIDHA